MRHELLIPPLTYLLVIFLIYLPRCGKRNPYFCGATCLCFYRMMRQIVQWIGDMYPFSVLSPCARSPNILHIRSWYLFGFGRNRFSFPTYCIMAFFCDVVKCMHGSSLNSKRTSNLAFSKRSYWSRSAMLIMLITLLMFGAHIDLKIGPVRIHPSLVFVSVDGLCVIHSR